MVPAYFTALEKLTLTPNGKVDKKALPDPGLQAGKEYIAPRNQTEETLAGIWAELLGLEKETISIDDNFFALGGHSLKATVMATKIHKEFYTKVPLSELFKSPSIRATSEFISAFESINKKTNKTIKSSVKI